ncbi:sugar ABC transporter permease [Paenibacillus qinlingensis]|uniref:Multiple sugar transport system permease protein n=1 Tax=Paenibacillus qinlingensis TaxID=1837343 RepID=A0ABU1P5P4_9BACL|nr:sugar ABC transporter permease [Paenibacillus qinlingensis]MDR6554869.1 multiple sugar transport system permease protein [Paenibacillus qinlingensis]
MKRKYTDYAIGYAFTLPYLIGAFVLFLIPAGMSLYYSFTRFKVISAPTFTGLANFQQLMDDKQFWIAFKNTWMFALLYVPMQVIIPLIFAVLLYSSGSYIKGKFASVLRAVYYFPAIPSWFIIGMVWIWLLSPDIGIVNQLLSLLGMSKVAFLQVDSATIIPTLAAVGVWKGLGYAMFIYYIGLNNIPETLYEAAEIDGVNSWQRLRNITAPLLSPTIFLVLIMAISDAFRTFDQHFVMVYNRSNMYSKSHLMVYLYEKAFRFLDMGYASLIAWVVFICLILITLVILKLQKTWVHYEE